MPKMPEIFNLLRVEVESDQKLLISILLLNLESQKIATKERDNRFWQESKV
jgi:hypothetical protein